MKMIKFGVFALLISAGIVLFSCKKDVAPAPACPTVISYANDLKPILDVNCSTSGCHDVSASGGYDLSAYSGVSANADVILHVINQEPGFNPMPQGLPKLADSTIQQFSCWIQQGKQDN